VVLSGRFRWSIRSRPQVALFCVAASWISWFCSTYATSELAARRFAWVSDMAASKPFSALPKLRLTDAP
jgi:hypothetical protein